MAEPHGRECEEKRTVVIGQFTEMAKSAGYFKKGNPGRPKGTRNRTTIYRAALNAVVNITREKAMWAAMLKKALEGDVSAARLIAEYKDGKPQQALTLNATVQHGAIPADELHEVALRSAERILRRNGRLRDGAVINN